MPDRQRPVSIIEKDLTKEQLDAGKRASDHINMVLLFHGHDALRDKCMAIRLGDGGSDGNVYDNRAEAIRFQLHEQQCYYVYFRNIPNGATAIEMAIMLEFQRRAYSAGMRLIDPDNPHGSQELLMTTPWYDNMRVSLTKRGLLP